MPNVLMKLPWLGRKRPEKASFDKLMAAADNAILAANGTLASIRKAIVT